MSLYFFHLRDGTDVLLDPEGRDLPSVAAIAASTLAEARHLISQDALTGTIKLNQRIDVEDRAGTVVHSLEFQDAIHIDSSGHV